MSYSATVFRVLIASPSDVEEEREISVRAIQDWNDQNSKERGVALLPVRWETHTSPEFGVRPQESINRQIVDSCDIIVAMFWTRIGTATGLADGGTLEEIARADADGKPVMIYFSRAKQHPDEIDVAQLAKLREFRSKTFTHALVENYSSSVDFRDKLTKQIGYHVKKLIASVDGTSERPAVDIKIQLMDLDTEHGRGIEHIVRRPFIDLVDVDKIPDFQGRSVASHDPFSMAQPDFGFVNKNRLRQQVVFAAQSKMFELVGFLIKNEGVVGARDVVVDFLIESTEHIVVLDIDDFPTTPPETSSVRLHSGPDSWNSLRSVVKKFSTKSWSISVELGPLQPQRLSPTVAIFAIAAPSECDVTITATFYADVISTPVVRVLTLKMIPTRSTVSAPALMKELLLGTTND